MIKLPSEKTLAWNQNNRSDILGTLWSSWNLDLTTQLGKTRVSPRTIITTNGISNLGTPVAFKQFNNKLWTVAGSFVFIAPNTRTETAFAQSALGSDPTNCSSDYSDLEVFSSKIWTTGGANLYYSGGSTWAFIDTGGGTSGLVSSTPHKLMAFLTTGRLYIIDSNQIKSTDGTTIANATTNTFTLSSSQSALNIVSMLQTSSLIWILCINPTDQTGYVITWDGVTQDTATNIIPLDSRGAMAGIVLRGNPHILTVDGRLQAYNGQVFTDVKNGQLPVDLTTYLKNPLDTANDRWIHPNGMTIVNGRINILINNENFNTGKTIIESLPSGVWEYDENIGWYHKMSLSQYDASVGTIKDFGQNRISRVGALSNIRTDNNSSDTYLGTLLIGADYFSDATTAVSAIWTNDALDSVQKYGYLVTTKIPAKEAIDSWSRTFLRIKKLLNTTDLITVKYRIIHVEPLEVSAIWDSSTSFHTSTNISAYAVGDEAEGIAGAGSGATSIITGITLISGVYNVTLSSSMGTLVGGTTKIRLQHWIKLGDSVNVLNNLIQLRSMGNATWVQLKVSFLFTGANELYNLILDNTIFQ